MAYKEKKPIKWEEHKGSFVLIRKEPTMEGYFAWLKKHKLNAKEHPLEEYVEELKIGK